MKAFLIYEDDDEIEYGEAGVAAIVFHENKAKALRKFLAVHASSESSHRDITDIDWVVKRVDVESGDVILATDYYAPSLEHVK